MTTVTVAIPFAGDDDGAFRLAVRSVFAQTETDWRLILIDDQADASLLAAARAIKDERVSVHSDGRRLGLAARLNQISSMCETDLLFRMDSDDAMLPERIATQKQILLGGDIDVCGGQMIAMNERSEISGFYDRRRQIASREQLLSAPYFSHPTVAGRTEWFCRNPYNETIKRAEDKELWLRTRENSSFHIVNQPLLFYRTPGKFDRAKSIRTFKDDIRVTWPYAQEWLGPIGLLKYAARAAVKACAYTFGGDRMWTAKLRATITDRDEAVARFSEPLGRVVDTEVKGWASK